MSFWGIFNSPKKPTKKFDFTAMVPQGGDPLDEVMKHLEEVGLRDGMPECHYLLNRNKSKEV